MKKIKLSVFRSNKYIYGQLIDEKGKTVISVSDLKDSGKTTKTEKAKMVGKKLAEEALKNKISEIVFDRQNFRYHGRVKALAEGAREGGLKF